VLEDAPPIVGDDEELGRTSAPPVRRGTGGPCFDHAFAYQVVQVPPDGGRGKAEPAAQRGRGRRPEFQDQPGDLAARTPLSYSATGGREIPGAARGTGRRSAPGVFHNISVP